MSLSSEVSDSDSARNQATINARPPDEVVSSAPAQALSNQNSDATDNARPDEVVSLGPTALTLSGQGSETPNADLVLLQARGDLKRTSREISSAQEGNYSFDDDDEL